MPRPLRSRHLAGNRLGGDRGELLLFDKHRLGIGLFHSMSQKFPCTTSRVAGKLPESVDPATAPSRFCGTA